MITAAELALLRKQDPGAILTGIDTATGNLLASNTLFGLSAISIQHSAPFWYDAANNLIRVTKNGAVLSGYNFGTAEVMIDSEQRHDQKLAPSMAATGCYSVVQNAGYSGAIIENDTFNGGSATNSLKLSAFIGAQNNITITGNSFLNAPGDAVDIRGGTVSGNYFSGEGYSSLGEHPDAIWVTDTNCPTVISNNFIDWTWANWRDELLSTGAGNDCVRITTEQGSVSNVTVSGNYLIGGAALLMPGMRARTAHSAIST